MKPRFATIAVLASLLSLAAVALPVTSASAGTKPVPGSGTVHCDGASGHLKFNPPLVSQHVEFGAQHIIFSLHFSGCTGTGNAVSLVAATVSGDSFSIPATNSCTRLTDGSIEALPRIKVTVAKHTPRIAPAQLSVNVYGATAATNMVFNILGGSVGTSFEGAQFQTTVGTRQTNDQINAACAGAGLSSLTVAGGPLNFG